MAAEISADEAVAAERSAAGVDVILLLPEGVPFGAEPGGPGRVAVFVTGGGPASASASTSGVDSVSGVDPISEGDRAAAVAMAAELFGGLVERPGASAAEAQRDDRPG